MVTITLKEGQLSLAEMRAALKTPLQVKLDPRCLSRIETSAKTVDSVLEQEQTVYGINTGFGSLAQTKIAQDKLAELQQNLILSHASGTGPLLDDGVVRLILVLKLNSLIRGFSGIRMKTVEYLLALLEADALPCIPAKGSVGASGDLAPLAHLSMVLLGEGEARIDGEYIAAWELLRKLGLEPLELQPKEGLALLNGTQVSTALALHGLFAAEDCLASSIVAGSLSVEASLSSYSPFDGRIHEVRGLQGQKDVAANFRQLLNESEINASHENCGHVQDPYSLRCQPQVLGACLDQMRFAAQQLRIEANAVTDNPLVFPEEGEILSGGNFHAEPVAMIADNLALAIAEIGALSERRISLLTDPGFSKLPAFLSEDPGLHSGFMVAQITSASLASENKSLAHPASVDSLPTSANQEDHVSMATFAARRLGEMSENTAKILGIELLAACQGIDFRRPLTTSYLLEEAHQMVRQRVPHLDRDRPLAPDIEDASVIIRRGLFNGWMRPQLLSD